MAAWFEPSHEETREGNRNRSVHQLSAYPQVTHEVSSVEATASGDREATIYLGPPCQARNSASRHDGSPARAQPSDSNLVQPALSSDLGRTEDVSTANTSHHSRHIRFNDNGEAGAPEPSRRPSLEEQYRRACIRSIFQSKPLPQDAEIQCDLSSEYPTDRGYFIEPLASTRLPQYVVNEQARRERQKSPVPFNNSPPASNPVSARPINLDSSRYRNRDAPDSSHRFSYFDAQNDRSKNSSRWENSTFLRESRTCDLLNKWNISFKGTEKSDPEEFLSRLSVCRTTFGFSLDDLLRTLPAVFDAEATLWFNREFTQWATYDDFVDAFRLQYGADDLQERLRQEIEHRTQGPTEDISTYLTKFRVLLDRVRPAIPLIEQLDRAYRNLHPSYRQRISRDQFVTFPELQKLGKRDEVRRLQDQAYKPPPTPDDSWFPRSAYVAPPQKAKRPIRVAAAASKGDLEFEVNTVAE